MVSALWAKAQNLVMAYGRRNLLRIMSHSAGFFLYAMSQSTEHCYGLWATMQDLVTHYGA
jgi:hypothetical protein